MDKCEGNKNITKPAETWNMTMIMHGEDEMLFPIVWRVYYSQANIDDYFRFWNRRNDKK